MMNEINRDTHIQAASARLLAVLQDIGDCAIAISGGVDSTTLAAVAAARREHQTRLYHALSPAVPEAATARLRAAALAHNWNYDEINARELDDPDYVANPANRCFFCKNNLYARIAAVTDLPICSGANLDDLSDYRPGLEAAKRYGVRHPFIDAGIGKATIRALAEKLRLSEFAALPASPCLASRIETDYPVTVSGLRFIQAAEVSLAERLAPNVLRCRLFHRGIVVELDADSLKKVQRSRMLLQEMTALVRNEAEKYAIDAPVAFAVYNKGAAFHVPKANATT